MGLAYVRKLDVFVYREEIIHIYKSNAGSRLGGQHKRTRLLFQN